MEGIFRPDAGSTLLAVSAKRFSRRLGAAVVGDFIAGDLTAGGQPVANGSKVFSEDVCLLLCRIHPRCLAAQYKVVDFTANAETPDVECTLAWGLDKLRSGKEYVSYVSV